MEWYEILICGIFAGLMIGLFLGEKNTLYHAPCGFCKHKVKIITYQKGEKDEKRIAKYCPICGRKLNNSGDTNL